MLADTIDILERLAIPLGVIVGIAVVAIFFRKAMKQSYQSGKRFGQKLTMKDEASDR